MEKCYFFKLYLKLISTFFFLIDPFQNLLCTILRVSIDHFSQQEKKKVSKKCWSCSRVSWLVSANLLPVTGCYFPKSIMLFVFPHYCFRGLFFTISWYFCNKMLLFPQVLLQYSKPRKYSMLVLSYHRFQEQHYLKKHHIAAVS